MLRNETESSTVNRRSPTSHSTRSKRKSPIQTDGNLARATTKPTPLKTPRTPRVNHLPVLNPTSSFPTPLPRQTPCAKSTWTAPCNTAPPKATRRSTASCATSRATICTSIARTATAPEVLLTCGNTDGFAKTLMALTDEWSAEKDCVHDRDALLVEKFCYMNAIQTARPRGLNIVPVEVDDEGMLAEGPGGLRQVLENWDFTKGRMPRLMYTVT